MSVRILISSDSATLPTGFAETTRLIFETLLARYPGEYELFQLGHFHSTSMISPGWPIYSTTVERDTKGRLRFPEVDKYGQLTFSPLCSKLKPDIVFGFGDPQGIAHLCVNPLLRNYSLIVYLTIDGMPVPEGYGHVLRHADALFTKSEFSLNVLRAAYPELNNLPGGFMYSPADIDHFRRSSQEERRILRQRYLPNWVPQDAFILGWVGRNQWRKQVWIPYKVIHYLRSGAYYSCRDCQRITCLPWNPSTQRHEPIQTRLLGSTGDSPACDHCGSRQLRPGTPLPRIILWNHMASDSSEWPTGFLEKQFNVFIGRDLLYTEDYRLTTPISRTAVRDLYNMFDCLLYLSGGEGFGMPAWEAMACEVPVVYTNYSSHGEFLSRANAGIGVSGVLQPEKESCINRMVADVPAAIEAVLRIYCDPNLARCFGANGREFVTRFEKQVQAERWHQIFQKHKSSPRTGRNCQVAVPLDY